MSFQLSGCSSVGLECTIRVREVAGSNPATPTRKFIMETNIQKHLEGVYEILKGKIALINQAIGHTDTLGSETESDLRKLLVEFLPPEYGIGSGKIVGTDGISSDQVDIIIYDKTQPNYMLMHESKIFLADHVIAALEVKTNYTQREEALENIRTVKRLKLSSKTWMDQEDEKSSTPPLGFIFFFRNDPRGGHKKMIDMNIFHAKLKEAIDKIPSKEHPDVLLSLYHATIFRYKDINPEARSKETREYATTFVQGKGTNTTMGIPIPEEPRIFVDFRREGFEIDEQIFPQGIKEGTKSKLYVLYGNENNPRIYRTAKFKGEKHLLDDYRAFLNFIWSMQKTMKIKQMNPNWDITDYLGENFVMGQDLDRD
jgi:hypothetical protein